MDTLPKNPRDPPIDAFRHYLALFVVITFPVAFSFWFSIHPPIGIWRKLGARLSQGIHFVVMGLVAAGLFLLCGKLLPIQFGTNLLLMALAVPILVLAFIVALQMNRVERFDRVS